MSKPTLTQVTKAGEFPYIFGIKDCESAHDWLDHLFAAGDVCHLEKPRIARYYNLGRKLYAIMLSEGSF